MLRDIRNNYQKYVLNEDDLSSNPIDQFGVWLNQALNDQINEPTAMVLSTVSEGRPDSRIVLLKELLDEGFVFYTNYNSVKGQQISQNSNVSLNFFWAEMERQVRVKGLAYKIDQSKSESYFKSRPYDSQLGAFVSKQSEEIENREKLEQQFKKIETEFEGNSVPMPEHWGGYVVKPFEIEFWQGRPSRMHDRIRYTLKDEDWSFVRLQP